MSRKLEFKATVQSAAYINIIIDDWYWIERVYLILQSMHVVEWIKYENPDHLSITLTPADLSLLLFEVDAYLH